MRVLVACECSGTVRDAFIARGHDAMSCDLKETEVPGPHYKGDVRNILFGFDEWDLVIAHPPCTHLAVSGARWFPEKRADGRQKEAIDFFMLFALLSDARPGLKVAIENPVGIMSSEYRKPDQYIQPWQFGHGEVKKTGLWLYNLPRLVPTNIVEGREPRIWKMGPSEDRARERSRTYSGIAKAMAEQWG